MFRVQEVRNLWGIEEDEEVEFGVVRHRSEAAPRHLHHLLQKNMVSHRTADAHPSQEGGRDPLMWGSQPRIRGTRRTALHAQRCQREAASESV